MTMRRAATSFLVLACFVPLAAGCGKDEATPPSGIGDGEPERGRAVLGPESGIELDVAEGDRFEPGDELTLVLRNGSDERIGYNLCTHDLERRTDGDWSRAEELEPRVCTMILHTLEPGETDRYETRLPESLSAGTYRYRTSLQMLERDERGDVVSDPITVVAEG